MEAKKLIILGIALFISLAVLYLSLFEYRADGSYEQGWYFRYSQPW